jgi:NTP pyrophosphatase (non-canonical NTP hydrolase)
MNEATDSMGFPKKWGEFADYYGYVDRSKESFIGEIEVIPRFRVEQWLEHIEPDVSPLPCVRDEHGEIREQSIKALLGKAQEEFIELVSEIAYVADVGAPTNDASLDKAHKHYVAEEAADTITAITTMLEALGIDADMRDEAQRRVNAKNRERGRL